MRYNPTSTPDGAVIAIYVLGHHCYKSGFHSKQNMHCVCGRCHYVEQNL